MVTARAVAITAAADASVRDVASIRAALVAAREVEGWVHARVAQLVRALSEVESFPEATIAETARCSVGRASGTRERAATLAATPGLAEALGAGSITAGHVDAVTRAAKGVAAARRGELLERVDGLRDVAEAATVEQFRRRIEREAAALRADDGEDRLARQRRSVRLSTWIDAEGMWNLRGRFDPVLGVRLSARLDATVEASFAERTPDGCPDDPV